MNCYACYNKQDDLRLVSSSGAVFSALAEAVLSEGGIVYGVKMSDDCYSAEFERVDNIEGLNTLRGSKYLQAHVGKAYLRVKEDLESDKKVLFTGTICQVNALKNYLGRKYSNLICVDVVCHGVPSPKLWRLYLEYVEEKKGKIKTVNFRSKKYGWSNYGLLLNKSYNDKSNNPYMQMFLKDYSLRPSCYDCCAKKTKQSDMSIADFWGVDSICKGMNDEKGTSLVIVRTDEGRLLFNKINDQLVIHEVDYYDAVKNNPSDYESAKKPAIRERFFDDMNVLTFKQLAQQYCPQKSIIQRTKKSIQRFTHNVVFMIRRRWR